MHTFDHQPSGDKSKAVANAVSKKSIQLKDNRQQSIAQKKQTETLANQTSVAPVQRQANNTGLPDNLKSGIENLSGHSMDDVKVHYNSLQPAQLNAHAYAQGTEIHLAPGQEKHLPHEAWHVVQQKQGRVRPTMQMKGKVNVNDDKDLEKEADVMGARALNKEPMQLYTCDSIVSKASTHTVIQRAVSVNNISQTAAVAWLQVRGLVEKVYRRKQTLIGLCSDGSQNTFNTYQELADRLDSLNLTQAQQGRGRPNWAPGIITHFDKTWGGKRHRRHIIMSSLMRDAVYNTTDNKANSNMLKWYNELIKLANRPGQDNVANAEAELVYILHNNPANLVLDTGANNSAIGSLAHNVDQHLVMYNYSKIDTDINIQQDFEAYKKNSKDFLDSLVKGFVPALQKQIIDTIDQHFQKPTSKQGFVEFMEMIYDNTAFDLMTKVGMPKDRIESLIGFHGKFIESKKGDLIVLFETCAKFINLGNNFNECPYSDIW